MLSILIAASIASCPIEHGHYELRGVPGVTARFHAVKRSSDWPAGLALRVFIAGSGRSYWFLPWQGGTDQRTNLAWVRESRSPIRFQSARRDLEMFATDASYNLQAHVPAAGGIAPVHMLLPDLGDIGWYSTADMQRDSIPRAFFDLTGCAASERTDAPPEIEFPTIP